MKSTAVTYSFNEDLLDLVEVKSRVNQLESTSNEYDSIRRLFDKISEYFNLKYGMTMEQIMYEIYNEFCPTEEVRPIDAYLAKHFDKNGDRCEFSGEEGVPVQLDDFSFKEGRLILLPNPARIVLQDPESSHQEILWQAA